MRGTAHAIIGISAGMALSSYLGVGPREVPWIAVLLGSLAPDIDEDESYIAKPGSFLRSVFPRTICDVLDVLGKTLAKVIKVVLGHRGLLHWPIVGIVIMGLGLRYHIYWLSWFGLGYLLHIAADACTVSGVPVFAPIRMEPVKWSSIKTGGLTERFIIAICGIYMIWWGIGHMGR